MKTIVLNTLEEHAISEKMSALINDANMEVINTSDMKIAHCMGCNLCWLKTPGICAIKDDYEGIIKKLVDAENLWLVSDTRFGFVDWHGKRVMDRIVPVLNMYVEFRDGLERHELRYHPLNFGLLYKGKADQKFFEEWSQRVASNLAGQSLGVYHIGKESASGLQKKGWHAMHVVIINGSPRMQKFSNTDKIIQSFVKGLQASGGTYELFSLSNRKEWDAARASFICHDQIIFALPLFVECVPSIMLEFLETLPTERQQPAQMSFILHGGFDEGHQLRLCERFLQSLPAQLGCTYGGCLVQGGSFLIRMREDEKMKKVMTKKLDAYTKMGQSFVSNGNFMTTEASKFTGPEKNPWIVHLLFRLFIKRLVRKNFERYAQQWGCNRPLDDKPYLNSK